MQKNVIDEARTLKIDNFGKVVFEPQKYLFQYHQPSVTLHGLNVSFE